MDTTKTPLEVAREFCAANPTAFPEGRYKVADLHDRGTNRLLADIAAAPARDMTLAEAEAELSRHTRTFTVALKRTWEVGTDVRSTEWSICACPKGGSSFGLFPSTSLRDAVAAAIKYMQPAAVPTVDSVAAQIDLGDGMGLPLICLDPAGITGCRYCDPLSGAVGECETHRRYHAEKRADLDHEAAADEADARAEGGAE